MLTQDKVEICIILRKIKNLDLFLDLDYLDYFKKLIKYMKNSQTVKKYVFQNMLHLKKNQKEKKKQININK